MALNAQSPIPLYRQLADVLSSEIEAGEHAVATKIPSEHELADRFEIGRPTVRQATDILVRQGRLERRRGSGTYVLPPSHSLDLFSLAGTSAALRKSSKDVRLEMMAEPVAASSQSLLASGMSVQGELQMDWVKLERQASVDGEPVLYETLWFDASVFTGVEQQPLKDRSISALVRDVYFLEPSSADQTFTVIGANTAIAKKLKVKKGTPLLRVQRQLHFGQNKNALLAEIICRTDRFEFSQTLYPSQVADAAL
ncbi:MAG: GntR family transcriptional regulator [Granulosicoccaceae bacterium]